MTGAAHHRPLGGEREGGLAVDGTVIARGTLAPRWTAIRAALGGLAWLSIAALHLRGASHLGSIAVLFLFAPLVAAPLGLELASMLAGSGPQRPLLGAARWIEPAAAALATWSFWLPRGEAWLPASAWLLATAPVGAAGLLVLVRGGRPFAVRLALAAGLVYLPVGAAALVLSRAGMTPMGFEEPIVLLLAVHYHYSGFFSPLLAAALGRPLARLAPRAAPAYPAAALGASVGPLLVAAGYLLHSAWLRVVAVHVLAASLAAVALLHLAVLGGLRNPAARALLLIAGPALLFGMACASIYEIGEFRKDILIGIPKMAETHGVANALGFVLCGLAGWLIVYRQESQAP